jgi:hypothetical protein
MATMMPNDIGEFRTEGEKTFYKFLEGVAKPVGFGELLGLLGYWVHRLSSKVVISDWPVTCAAERIIGNDSYLCSHCARHYVPGKHYQNNRDVPKQPGRRFQNNLWHMSELRRNLLRFFPAEVWDDSLPPIFYKLSNDITANIHDPRGPLRIL